MAGVGAITVPAAGAVTEPVKMPLTVAGPVVLPQTHEAPYSGVLLPGSRGLMLGNGLGFIFHIVNGAMMSTGILAPETAPAAAFKSPGAAATGRIDTTGNHADNDRMDLVSAGDQENFSWPVVFVTAFDTSGEFLRYYQVLVGASASATLDNLVSCINGTSGEGSTYQSPRIHNGVQTEDHPARWSDWITATKTSASRVTFTAARAGTPGNSYEILEVKDSGGAWSVTAFSGGAAGTGTAPKNGSRRWAYLFKRALDNARSGISPLVDLETDDQGNVALSSLTSAPSALATYEKTDAKTWVRTLTEAEDLFEGYDVVAADTTDDDDIDDDDLADRTTYDPALYRTYEDGMVPRYRILVPFKGMVLGMGYIPMPEYSIGTADVTFGSSTVTLSSGTLVRRTREGQEFRVSTDASTEAVRYRIIWIDEANRQLHLDRAIETSTNATAAYAIRDTRSPFEVGWCEPGQPNLWPAANTALVVTGPDPEGIVAAVPAFGGVVIFTRTGIWMLSGSYGALRIRNEYEGAGCVGKLAAVACDDGYVRFLANPGVYAWAGPGSGEPIPISHGRTKEGRAWGIGDTIRRINRGAAHAACAHVHPNTKVLRFAVPLDDDRTNRHCLVLDLQSRVWSVDDVPDLTFLQTVYTDDGVAHVVAGDVQGDVWELDVSNSDGAFDFEPVATVTSATVDTVTCSGASFPTTGDGLAGVPVVLVRTSTGEIEVNSVASNTGTVLTLARYTTALAASDVVIVGGIVWWLQSGKCHFGSPALLKSLFMFRVLFAPQSDGTYYAAFAADQDDPTVSDSTVQGDFTLTSGSELFLPSVAGNALQFLLLCLEPGCDPSIVDAQSSLEHAGALHV